MKLGQMATSDGFMQDFISISMRLKKLALNGFYMHPAQYVLGHFFYA
jgi:hypothetical protein